MAKAQVYVLRGVKDSGWTALARVRLPSGQYITQSQISTITVTVKKEDGTKTQDAVSLTKGDVVFDTLQTDNPRWTDDATGYNFAHEVPAAAFPTAGHYRAEFHFTPVSGEPFAILFEGPVLSRFD